MPIAVYYLWEFGDGRISTEPNPVHIYKMPGRYTVRLTITTDGGDTYTLTREDYIYVFDWAYLGTGIDVSRTNQCLRYSSKASNGIGWSIFSGDGWPYPEARVGTLKIIDGIEEERLLVFDAPSGRVFEIAVRDVFRDEVGAYSGSEISTEVVLPEEIGNEENYKKKSLEHHLNFRPHDEDNKGEDGYSATGYRTGFEVEFALRKDGSISDTLRTIDIPIDGDIVFKHEDEAHRWQPLFRTNTSEWKLVATKDQYIAMDKAAQPDERWMAEDDFDTALNNVTFHLGRNELNPLLDIATGNTLTGSYTAVGLGPDSRINSALEFDSSGGLTSINTINLTGNFSVLMWLRAIGATSTVVTDGNYSCIVAVSGTQYFLRFSDTAGNLNEVEIPWKNSEWMQACFVRVGDLMRIYYNGSLLYSQPLSSIESYSGQLSIMSSVAGAIFDVRVNALQVSQDAINYHYRDVVQREGAATCPLY